MRISPLTLSTSFFFHPEIDSEEEQAESPSQPTPLKDRFYAGVINLPHIMPRAFADVEYERTKRLVIC
jgi:hypothetical protein